MKEPYRLLNHGYFIKSVYIFLERNGAYNVELLSVRIPDT